MRTPAVLKTRQVVRRLAVLVVAVVGTVVPTATASAAATPETWTEREPRPWLETLGLFVGLPLALFAVIALLVVASNTRRGPRYRPDQGWWAEPAWLGAPQDAESEGGDQAGRELTGARTDDGGGASARW